MSSLEEAAFDDLRRSLSQPTNNASAATAASADPNDVTKTTLESLREMTLAKLYVHEQKQYAAYLAAARQNWKQNVQHLESQSAQELETFKKKLDSIDLEGQVTVLYCTVLCLQH
jgi:hypothetical protein